MVINYTWLMYFFFMQLDFSGVPHGTTVFNEVFSFKTISTWDIAVQISGTVNTLSPFQLFGIKGERWKKTSGQETYFC